MRILKWIGLGLGGLLVLLLVAAAGAVGVGAFLFERQAHATVPAGYARDTSLYVTSSDGTKIAIDVWLPEDMKAGAHVPALIKGTPYWRARRLSWLGEAMAVFLAPSLAIEPDVPFMNRRGYAVVGVDARGTGASFGTLTTMFSDAEVNDYGAVADWIARQPWSNGKVGAYGFSYRGVTAASIASLPNPQIKAVAPSFDMTDVYLLSHPGGVFGEYLLHAWGAQTRDLNDGKTPCDGDLICTLMIRGPKPVDADTDGALLKAAGAAHAKNYNVYNCAKAAPARDDVICTSGQSLDAISLLARKEKIEARGLPMFDVAGWLDQTSPGQVLHRFTTFRNKQEVVLGPFTHGGFDGDDPYGRALDMPYREQVVRMADFFDRYLKDGADRPIDSSVHYYVLGGGVWLDTATWPPPGSTLVKWYPDDGHALAVDEPAAGNDVYKVDFAATTGALSGYRGQVDLSKTDYGDRGKSDKRLLAYTSAPLTKDVEIAGNPLVHLKLATSATDGVVIVYLEDIGPNGHVTYLSTGLLRLAHRKLAAAPVGADPLHTYLKADMAPMTPGTAEDIVIAISPIAALIRKGHRVRIAIAGADADNLERLPAQGDATLTLTRGAGTYVEIPQMP